MVSVFRRLLLVAAFAVPILVAATPSTTSPIQLNPRDVTTVPVPIIGNKLKQASNPLPSPETNAQRMKRGLGPKMPKFGRSKRSLYPRQSSSPCTSPTGNIRVEYVNDDGATIDGFLGSVPNDFGEYPFFDTQDNALRVQLNNCGSNNAFNILTLNGIASQPYLGLIDGFSNESPFLDPGSYNYVYLGGTSETPPGSAPQVQSNSFTDATDIPEAVESAVWELGPNNVLSAAWVNPDNTIPAEILLYVPSAGTFTVTADLTAFRETFGPAFPVSFTFVPA